MFTDAVAFLTKCMASISVDAPERACVVAWRVTIFDTLPARTAAPGKASHRAHITAPGEGVYAMQILHIG